MIQSKVLSMPAEKLRLAKMLKALGNPIRFQIVETLAERQTCITAEIVETTPLAQSTVSQHLKVLKECRFDPRRDRRSGDLLLPGCREYSLAEGSDRELAAGLLQCRVEGLPRITGSSFFDLITS